MFLHLILHLTVKTLTAFNASIRLNIAFCVFVSSATVYTPTCNFQFRVKWD